MKINVFHIILSFFLTIAVNDYLWIDLVEDDAVAIELEKEEKEESREEVRETKTEEIKHHFFSGNWGGTSYTFCFKNIASGVVKHGNSFRPLIQNGQPKLFILFCQLRLAC